MMAESIKNNLYKKKKPFQSLIKTNNLGRTVSDFTEFR